MPFRCTIDHNHKWWVYSLFAYLDCWWAIRVISYAILLSIDEHDDSYELSYGQV